MNLRQYLFFLSTGTLIAGFAWVMVLLGITPTAGSAFPALLFYTTFFFALVGLFATGATVLRHRRGKMKNIHHIVSISLRQGVLLALLMNLCLFLLSQQRLSLLGILLIILLIGAVEFFFLSLLHKAP